MSNRLYKNILEKIPPGKFIAPCIDTSKHLAREKFISAIAKRGRNKSVIFVTAQAGQGKTIFARQYLDYCQAPFTSLPPC